MATKRLPDHLFSGSRNPNQPDHLTGGINSTPTHPNWGGAKYTGSSGAQIPGPATGQPPTYGFNEQPGQGITPGITGEWYQQRQDVHGQEVDAVIAQMRAANEVQAQSALAGLGGVAAQRQAALYGQKAGLRDIEQATEQGVETATNQSLQRGIYNSGIRQENQLTAVREGAEAEQDLRAQTQFRLQALASQAAQMRAQAAAIRAGGAVQTTQTQMSMNQGFQQQMLNNLLQYGYTPEEANRILGQIPSPSQGGGGHNVAGIRSL